MTHLRYSRMARHPLANPVACVLDAVLAAVASRFSMTPTQLAGRARYDNIGDIRALAFFLCFDLSTATFEQLGERFGRTRWAASVGARQGMALAQSTMRHDASAISARVTAALKAL